MHKEYLIEAVTDFVRKSPENYIQKEYALSEDVIGTKIYEDPLFAFGSADDEYFSLFKSPDGIGEHFLTPSEWLPSAKTVISFFLPFSEQVKISNGADKVWPSNEWLHARIEGHNFLCKVAFYLQDELKKAGYVSIIPTLDERFQSKAAPDGESTLSFTSNWSERHVGFACGLGTFGLSKGLITKKGMAGRIGSLVTDLQLSATEREYKDLYEYCSKCGACIRQCPVNAISKEYGKKHLICSSFLDKIREKYQPRYGCGKCQVKVPCSSRIPTTIR
ncbi:MAG: 4Fe-4S binding protein [Acidaminococcaceae bacterium]